MSAEWPLLIRGETSQDLVWAVRTDYHRHPAYLYAPLHWKTTIPPVGVFEAEADIQKAPVVGYASIPMEFSSDEFEALVARQYPQTPKPEHAFFGPSFFARRKVLEQLEKYHLLPKHEAVAEQAWAYAFATLGIKPRFLHEYDVDFMASGDAAPFRA